MATTNLEEAFYRAYVGEAKAALRLKVFAEKAAQEGYRQIAKLFRAISRSEEIHGMRSLQRLDGVGSTEQNLRSSFESETNVAHVAYDRFIKMASKLGDQTAVNLFSQARDVEETHAKLYKTALSNLAEERDPRYFVCTICGYISDGTVPDECPVCGAANEQFEVA